MRNFSYTGNLWREFYIENNKIVKIKSYYGTEDYIIENKDLNKYLLIKYDTKEYLVHKQVWLQCYDIHEIERNIINSEQILDSKLRNNIQKTIIGPRAFIDDLEYVLLRIYK